VIASSSSTEVNVASLTMYRMNRTTIVRSPDANVSRPISADEVRRLRDTGVV